MSRPVNTAGAVGDRTVQVCPKPQADAIPAGFSAEGSVLTEPDKTEADREVAIGLFGRKLEPYSSSMEPIGDADREVMRRVVQDALAREQIGFDELDDRFGAIYSASNRAELDAVIADLPAPPPPVPIPRGHPISGAAVSLFGDVEQGGDIEIGSELTCLTLFGDVRLDLSTARIEDGTRVMVYSLFGEVQVIVPDGIRVDQRAVTLFGDQKSALSPPFRDAPTIIVSTWLLFGDTEVYSLSRVPEGRLRRLWKALRRGSP